MKIKKQIINLWIKKKVYRFNSIISNKILNEFHKKVWIIIEKNYEYIDLTLNNYLL